jgi:hypothetical protein
MSRPVKAINASGCRDGECGRKAICRGLCNRHYRKVHYVEHERARRGAKEAIRYEIGDTRPDSQGYLEEKFGPGRRDWKKQHRLVMERAIGRELKVTEYVHHIRGNRKDNRLEMLELWTSAQPKGQRAVDLLEFAKEIIEQYGALHADGII